MNDSELDSFFANFYARLYGHERFKEEFKELVNSFRVFNKLGEHKILSLFLMGDSGVGKTEVARSIHKALGSKAKLAKINFGNYSSHDALNSLIGSPLGYIGSDGGELLKRVNESDVGLILIDGKRQTYRRFSPPIIHLRYSALYRNQVHFRAAKNVPSCLSPDPATVQF